MTGRLPCLVLLLVAFAGTAHAQSAECTMIKELVATLRHNLAEEKRRVIGFSASTREYKKLVDDARTRVQQTQNSADFARLRTFERGLQHVEASEFAARSLESHLYDQIVKLQIALEGCNSAAPPLLPPPTPPPPPGKQTADRGTFSMKGVVATRCRDAQGHMPDNVPVDFSVKDGKVTGSFFAKGKSLLMTGTFGPNGQAVLTVLAAPELSLSVSASYSPTDGRWYAGGQFVNPTPQVTQCYNNNIIFNP